MDEDILWGGLNHVVTTESHVTDVVENVNDTLCLHLTKHCVDCDKGTSSTNTSTESVCACVCVCVCVCV